LDGDVVWFGHCQCSIHEELHTEISALIIVAWFGITHELLCSGMSWHPKATTSTHLISYLELGTRIVSDFDDNTSSIAAKNKRPGSDEQASTAHIRVTVEGSVAVVLTQGLNGIHRIDCSIDGLHQDLIRRWLGLLKVVDDLRLCTNFIKNDTLHIGSTDRE
jgi:hypothetical protein